MLRNVLTILSSSRMHVGRVRARRGLARIGRRLAPMLLSIAFVISVFQAGSRYFFCPMMNAVVSAHCCTPAAEHSGDDVAPALEQPDCCQRRTIEALPPADAVGVAMDVVAAPLASVLLPLPRPEPSDFAVVRVRHRAMERAGPPTPTGPERAARLGVFLI